MSATNQTTHYGFPLFTASDKPSWLGDWNAAMIALDAAIYEASQTGSGESETAQEALAKAEQALTAATAAQSAASNAQSTATSAKTTANTANTNANSALTNISELSTTVSTMQTSLSKAQSDILTLQQSYSSLDTRVTTANTNASTALTTAQTANNNASSASTKADSAEAKAASALATANSAQTGVNGLQTRVTSVETKVNNITDPNPMIIPFYMAINLQEKLQGNVIGVFYANPSTQTAEFDLWISLYGNKRQSTANQFTFNAAAENTPFSPYPWLEPLNLNATGNINIEMTGTEFNYLSFLPVNVTIGASSTDVPTVVLTIPNFPTDSRNELNGTFCIRCKFSGNEWELA